MNKTEFLQELEKRLHVLNEQERKDVLEEYAQHINLKIEERAERRRGGQSFWKPGGTGSRTAGCVPHQFRVCGGSIGKNGGTNEKDAERKPDIP